MCLFMTTCHSREFAAGEPESNGERQSPRYVYINEANLARMKTDSEAPGVANPRQTPKRLRGGRLFHTGV